MTREETIIFFCIIVVFGFFYNRLCVHGVSKNQRVLEKARNHGYVVSARLVKKWRTHRELDTSGNRKYPSMNYIYEYEIEGKKYKKRIHQRLKPGNRVILDDVITLYYDPKKPSKAITIGQASKEHQMGNGCLLTMLYTFCVMQVIIKIVEYIFGS